MSRTPGFRAFRIGQEALLPEPTHKKCSVCGEVKPIEAFVKAKNKRDGYTGRCKACKSKCDRANYTVEKGRRGYMKNKYGITLEDYDDLHEWCEGRCAICGATNAGNKRPLGKKGTGRPRPEGHGNRLYVDHDHDTGEVRTLLCNRCNRGLGAFEDDLDRMLTAQRFLAAWTKYKETRDGRFRFRGWDGD